MSMIGFDRPVPAHQARTIRAVVGTLAASKFVLTAVELSLVRRLFDGPDGTDLLVAAMVFGALAGSVALAVGVGARRAAAGVVAAAWLLMLTVPSAASHHLYLITLLVMLVGLLPADLPRQRGAVVPGWPVALMRCQLTIMYGFTAVSKANTDFASGLVAYQQVRDSVVPLPLPGGLDRSLPVLAGLSIGLIALEAALAAGVWVERLRPIAFAVALPLHVGMTFIAASDWQTAAEIAVFSGGVFVLYFAFVDTAALQAIAARTTGARAAQARSAASPWTFLIAPWRSVPGLRRRAERRLGTVAGAADPPADDPVPAAS